MGDPTKRGKKIVTSTYNSTAHGVTLSWNFNFENEYHPQPDEDSVVDDAQLLMHQGITADVDMIHAGGADSQTAHALSITERLGDGTTRVIPLGNHVVKSFGGSHGEGGVTVFKKQFVSIGAVTMPSIS